MKMFAVLDVKANMFQRPLFETSTVNALRAFELSVNEPGTIYNSFPDDFCLCEFGEFDVQTGHMVLHASYLNLGTARSLLRLSGSDQIAIGTPGRSSPFARKNGEVRAQGSANL